MPTIPTQDYSIKKRDFFERIIWTKKWTKRQRTQLTPERHKESGKEIQSK